MNYNLPHYRVIRLLHRINEGCTNESKKFQPEQERV